VFEFGRPVSKRGLNVRRSVIAAEHRELLVDNSLMINPPTSSANKYVRGFADFLSEEEIFRSLELSQPYSHSYSYKEETHIETSIVVHNSDTTVLPAVATLTSDEAETVAHTEENLAAVETSSASAATVNQASTGNQASYAGIDIAVAVAAVLLVSAAIFDVRRRQRKKEVT